MTPPWPASISDDVVVEHAVYDASSLIIEFVVYLHVAAVVPLSVLLFVACVAISLSLVSEKMRCKTKRCHVLRMLTTL